MIEVLANYKTTHGISKRVLTFSQFKNMF